jgi:hypothetical protein
VDPSTSAYNGELVGTNDVVNGEISAGQEMTVKLHGKGETDLFMMYQKTEGVTVDIADKYESTFNNHVVIVEQSGDSQVSWVKASLAPGDMYSQKNWNGGTLVVQVCSITPGRPDVAKVISFVDGVTTTPPSCFKPEGACVDTKRKFYVRSKLRHGGCRWAQQHSRRNTKKRCNKGKLSSMCPVTCGTCGYEQYIDGGQTFRVAGSNKRCSWISQRPDNEKATWCNKSGVNLLCRFTCRHSTSVRKNNIFLDA